MVLYRYSGRENLGELIGRHMKHGDHIVRMRVTNIRTSKSTLLCFRVTRTDGKSLEGTSVECDDGNNDIEPGKHVTIKSDATPVVIEVG